MPVKLRLRRQGRRKHAHYAIVAADTRAPRDGRFIEKIGHYDPVAEPARVYVDHDSALKWLKVGAQPTNTVRSLLRHSGVTLKFALIKQGKSEEEMDRIYTRWRNEKDRKPKKKMVMVDEKGRFLEPVPESSKPVKKKPAPVEEEAPVEKVVVEAPQEEAVVKEEAAVEEAPVEETAAETTQEEPLVEETPVAESTSEEVIAEAPAEPEVEAKEEEVAEEAPEAETPAEEPTEPEAKTEEEEAPKEK